MYKKFILAKKLDKVMQFCCKYTCFCENGVIMSKLKKIVPFRTKPIQARRLRLICP